MIRLVNKNGVLNITCNKLFDINGKEVLNTKYLITKGNVYKSITDIDINDKTFKVGLNDDDIPLLDLQLGEMIYLKTDKFDFPVNIVNKGDNLYQINLDFPSFSWNNSNEGQIKRLTDTLTLIELEEGIYYTDTNYIIFVSNFFEPLLKIDINQIYQIDGTTRSMDIWQLVGLIDIAYQDVMRLLQEKKIADDLIKQYKYLDIDGLLELQRYRVLSLYEATLQESTFKYTRRFDVLLTNFEPFLLKGVENTPPIPLKTRKRGF